MLKQTKTIFSLLIITALLSSIVTLSIPGCTPNQADYALEQNGTSEPKENPKLDYSLNQLVLAEWRGEVEEFAQSRNIELLYNDAGLVSVKAVLECLPGQVVTATEVAEDYGTVEVYYLNSIMAVVPVSSLSALADEESIGIVRLPEYPEGAE